MLLYVLLATLFTICPQILIVPYAALQSKGALLVQMIHQTYYAKAVALAFTSPQRKHLQPAPLAPPLWKVVPSANQQAPACNVSQCSLLTLLLINAKCASR
jgi:hypothetical protein